MGTRAICARSYAALESITMNTLWNVPPYAVVNDLEKHLLVDGFRIVIDLEKSRGSRLVDAAAQCIACHADKRFIAKGLACADCHVDDHHKGTLGTPSACVRCHNSVSWKAWNFDHDTATRFPLTGRHHGLICSACHGRAGDPAKIGGQCIDCHRRDDKHRGEFGEDCARCHVTDNFRQIIVGAKR